jgi:hypothetical protein
LRTGASWFERRDPPNGSLLSLTSLALSARLLGPHLERATDEATVYRELALRLERNYAANEKLLVRWRVGYHVGLYWLFRAACIALAVETFAWLVVLAL